MILELQMHHFVRSILSEREVAGRLDLCRRDAGRASAPSRISS